MITRYLFPRVLQALADVPAVCLLGPRQVGKTTLALRVAEHCQAVYLDLESEQDRAKLSDPEASLALHLDKLVILDELHRMPDLFSVLRGMIDRARRQGKRSRCYLLLGSASLGLLRQSGESLAGRVRFLELTPFFVLEPTGRPVEQLWIRGGFPESLLAGSDGKNFRFAGASWEGLVIEQLAASAPDDTTLFFYRTAGGAEVDLRILLPDGQPWAVDITRSLAPRVERGFHAACQDLTPDRAFVVYPGTERYPLSQQIEAIGVRTLAAELAQVVERRP